MVYSIYGHSNGCRKGSLVRTVNDLYRLHIPLWLVKGLADRDTGLHKSNNNGDFQAYTRVGGVGGAHTFSFSLTMMTFFFLFN